VLQIGCHVPAEEIDELEPVEREREPTLCEAFRRSCFARRAGFWRSVGEWSSGGLRVRDSASTLLRVIQE
jgi:hypothetical protein